jgi:UDP-N-acetylmuramyl pentapeptide synthase
MSTSFRGDFQGENSSSATLSLRSFLGKAVFVGAEDIAVLRCANQAEKCRPGDVFIPQITAAGDEHDNVDVAIRRGAV